MLQGKERAGSQSEESRGSLVRPEGDYHEHGGDSKTGEMQRDTGHRLHDSRSRGGEQ